MREKKVGSSQEGEALLQRRTGGPRVSLLKVENGMVVEKTNRPVGKQ